MNAEDVADALGGKWEHTQYRCRCPVHGGHSLMVKPADRTNPLISCFGGCEFRDIVRELKAQGLWEDDADHDPNRPSRRKLEWCRWVVKITEATPRAELTEADRRDYNVARKLLREWT